MKKEKFVKCLDKGMEMLAFAKSDEWDDVEAIEPEWSAMLYSCFDEKSNDDVSSDQYVADKRALLEELLAINQEIISLGQVKHQFLNEKVFTFTKGKKALRAYQV